MTAMSGASAGATPNAGRLCSMPCDRRFGDRIQIDGADAGLHVVVWFRDLTRRTSKRHWSRLLGRKRGRLPCLGAVRPARAGTSPPS